MVSLRQLLKEQDMNSVVQDNVSQLTIMLKHSGLQRINVDHHDAAGESFQC